MKFRLQAGSEIDVLTKDELRDALAEQAGLLAAGASDVVIRPSKNGKTDGAGALLLADIYMVPIGMELALNRLLIEADGFTPGVPFQGAGAFADVLRSGKRVDFFSFVAGAPQPNSIPALSVDGNDAATRFRNGESVSVQLVAGPANTNVTVTLQGHLQPLPERHEARHSKRHGHGRR